MKPSFCFQKALPHHEVWFQDGLRFITLSQYVPELHVNKIFEWFAELVDWLPSMFALRYLKSSKFDLEHTNRLSKIVCKLLILSWFFNIFVLQVVQRSSLMSDCPCFQTTQWELYGGGNLVNDVGWSATRFSVPERGSVVTVSNELF